MSYEVGRALDRYAGKRGTYRVLVGKPVEKRPFGRNRGRWKDKIKMDLIEIGREGVDWMETGGGLLWTRQWNFRLHKIRGLSWLDEKPLACQEGFWSVKLGEPMSNLTPKLFQKARISMSEFRVFNCRVKDSRPPNCSCVQPAAVWGVAEWHDFRFIQRCFGDVSVSLGEGYRSFRDTVINRNVQNDSKH